MPYKLLPLAEEHLNDAVALFTGGYRREQQESPLLPPRAAEDPAWIHESLREHVGNPGVAVMDEGKLLAYMLTGSQFQWKGQCCVLVPEFAHSAVEANKPILYQRMYMYMARQWVAKRMHLHLIGYLAHDRILQETLYQLGYGAILAERLRDLSPISAPDNIPVVQVKDADELVELELEHNRFYPRSPIFLQKDSDAQQARAGLEQTIADGDLVFAFYDQHIPCAYLTVGTSELEGEGFLLRESNSAQIKSAYAQPAYRGQGIGAALLQEAIMWARDHGYERLMVEHETANIFGGNFWRKHFEPYVYYAMRYVDNTL